MCRIAGFWDFNSTTYDKKKVLRSMTDSLSYGGPDSADYYNDEEQNLGLGHRRLSILDLSEAGKQPMYFGDWVMIFNGEVYNYETPRKALEQLGYQFESNTDTEVLLKAFDAWGKDMINHFRGMFAIALWNRKTQTLWLGRDRLGVKPLYWYWHDDVLMFASELKAFHEHPKFDKTISQKAVSLFLRQGYIQQPYCIFEHAHKLEAGYWLETRKDKSIHRHQYWNLEEIYQKTTIDTTRNEEDWADELEELLTESFRLRMVADVPVGAFLSGGFDSSTVVALLQKKVGVSDLQTFTIGFEDKEYNEAEHAKVIAERLGTKHHELYCSMTDFEAIVPKLPYLYDEPMGDSSAIPTHLVAQLAKQHVKVSLSADGGDELFGGYTKYEITERFYPRFQRYPRFMRSMGAGFLGMFSPLWLERNGHKIPVLKRYKNISNKIPKLRNALTAKTATDFFHIASSYIAEQDLGQLHQPTESRYTPNFEPRADMRMGYWGLLDCKTYLEGDILTKVDRATMHCALEGRDPLLDHVLLEFAMRVPDELKLKGNTTKYLLRKVLYRHLPQELMDRPKQGFSIPIQQWLLGSLVEELKALSEDKTFANTFHLNLSVLQQIINNFIQQKVYINPHFIWFLYTLYSWYKRWMK